MQRLISVVMRSALIGIPVCLTGQTGALASGFALPELSTAGIGTANALVANPIDPGAFAYNPAAMGFHDTTSLAVGALFIGPSFEVTTGAGNQDSQGADWIATPMIQGALKINEAWHIGLGINAPFGLETRWPIGTFPALTRSVPAPPTLPEPRIPLSPQPLQSKLEILDFVPTGTYKVNDNLSVAAGLDFYWGKSAVLNSSLANLDGDGSGWGYNLSFLFKRDALSLGGSYHSSATIKVEGNYQPQSQDLVILGRLLPGQSAKLDLDLPWRLQLGLRYAFTERLAAEFDWTLTGWSQFEKITVKTENSGAIIQQDINDWSNANAYRLGLTYQLRPTTLLRLGYSYDETGQGDQHFSARVPDSDRNLFGIGLGQDLGGGWALDVGYMYVDFNGRNYRSATAYTGGSNINGTNAIDGKYEAHANLFGLEIHKTF